MKRVLVVEQHPERGLAANIVISHYLRSFGLDAPFSLTGASLLANLVSLEPDLVYLPWISPPVYRFLKKRAPEVPLLNAFQEQQFLIDNPSAEGVKRANKSDHLLLWTPGLKEVAEKELHGPELHVTGNPRCDIYFNELLQRALLPTRRELAERFDLNPSKKWVLVALDYTKLFQSPQKREMLRERGYLKEDDLERYAASLQTFSEWISRFVRDHDEYQFILRPHPGTPIEGLKERTGLSDGPKIRFIFHGTIDRWIIHCRYFLTRFSTSIVEAWMANSRAAQYLTQQLPDRYQGYKHVVEGERSIDSYDALVSFLRSDADSQQRQRHSKFIEDHYTIPDGHSCLRTARIVAEIAESTEKTDAYKSFPVEDSLEKLKARVKRYLNESGLNELNPFPRPNDIYLEKYPIEAKLNALAETLPPPTHHDSVSNLE